MTLTDERIERMRDNVLTGVDADVQRRGRRTRRALGATMAACFVVVIGGVGLTAVTGGSGSTDYAGEGSSTVDTSPPSGEAEGDKGAVDAPKAEQEGSSEGDDLTSQPPAERDVVVTGTVDVGVDRPREAAAELAAWVSARDGRMDSRSEQSTDGRSSAHLTVRVPVDEVDAMLAELDEIGDVNRVSVDREEVGAQRRDLAARIDALEVSIDRLESILADSSDSTELLATERAIQERQGELESLQSQQEALSEQVALSTITVNLSQSGEAVDDRVEDRDGFLDGLRTGWDALVEFTTSVVRVAGVLLPWLAVPVVAYAAWRLVRRVRPSKGTPRR